MHIDGEKVNKRFSPLLLECSEQMKMIFKQTTHLSYTIRRELERNVNPKKKKTLPTSQTAITHTNTHKNNFTKGKKKKIYNLIIHKKKRKKSYTHTIGSITSSNIYGKWLVTNQWLHSNPIKLTKFKIQKRSIKLTITHESGLKKILSHENLVRWIDRTLIDRTLLDFHDAIHTWHQHHKYRSRHRLYHDWAVTSLDPIQTHQH